MLDVIIDLVAVIVILIGVILVYDARIITKKMFGFGDQNEATSGLKILGSMLSLVGALIIAGLLIWRNSANKNKGEEVQQAKKEFVQVLEDGTKVNISNKLKEEKTINGLTIGNIQLTE